MKHRLKRVCEPGDFVDKVSKVRQACVLLAMVLVPGVAKLHGTCARPACEGHAHPNMRPHLRLLGLFVACVCVCVWWWRACVCVRVRVCVYVGWW